MTKKQKRANSKNKKKHSKSKFILLTLILIILAGGAGGYFYGEHLIQNDKFEIIGQSVVNLELGQEYQEEGAVAIAFGKKLKDEEIKKENNIDTSKPGQYYVKYTANNIRFKGKARYRVVIVKAPEESEVQA